MLRDQTMSIKVTYIIARVKQNHSLVLSLLFLGAFGISSFLAYFTVHVPEVEVLTPDIRFYSWP